MKEKEFLRIFERYPVFTSKQVAALYDDPGYSRVRLHRMVKTGEIIRLRKGIFTTHTDPMIYSSHILYPSYISLWQALNFHGLTTQLPVSIDVMAPKTFSVLGASLHYSPFLWGYKKYRYGDFEIFVADIEKIVIDALFTGLLSDDEIGTALANSDRKVLEDYAIRTERNSLIKQVGFFSERNGIFLDRAYEHIKNDRNYVAIPGSTEQNRWRVKGK